jgi:hypothetical protein
MLNSAENKRWGWYMRGHKEKQSRKGMKRGEMKISDAIVRGILMLAGMTRPSQRCCHSARSRSPLPGC